MGDPRSLLPHEAEIFVLRELRKAGLEASAMKARERTRGAGSDDYTVDLRCSLRIGDADSEVIIECRNEKAPVSPAIVQALHAKLRDTKTRHAMMFSTTGFERDAVHAARSVGIPLLAVADGKSAFARSPWGMAGDPPAWVPEYMAELVDLDIAGKPRHTLLEPGGARRILDGFKTRPDAPGVGEQRA